MKVAGAACLWVACVAGSGCMLVMDARVVGRDAELRETPAADRTMVDRPAMDSGTMRDQPTLPDLTSEPAYDTGADTTVTLDSGADTTVTRDTGATADRPDAQDSVVPDRAVADAPPDVPTACGTASDCNLYACYCGACSPSVFECITDRRSCMLGCLSFPCSDELIPSCACVAGRCVVVPPRPDGGMTFPDGGGGAGTSCHTELDCAAGLLCCSPCGGGGCPYLCTPPTPDDRCP